MYCPHCGVKDNLKKNGTRKRENSMQPQWLCKSCKRSTASPLNKKPKTEPVFKQYEKRLPKTKRYVFTAAQNATPTFTPGLKSLLNYCDHNEAELVICPLYYRNTASTWGQAQPDANWWAEDLRPYLYSSRSQINGNLIFLGDVRHNMTAVRPLTGFESITGGLSGILPHPKLQLRSIATPHHKLPKLMTTTGAITVENYTHTPTGKKGDFHHTYGAVVVETDGDVFFMRQLTMLKNGTFIDKDKKYTPEGIEDAPPAEAIIFGDSHIAFIDPGAVKAGFEGDDSMVSVMNPKRLIWHDVYDHYSQNHHDRDNPFIQLAKYMAHMSNIPAELALTCDFINKYGAGRENILVPSNHNEGLERYIRETDWRKDPSHMEFYLETALEMVRNTEMTDAGARTIDPFHYWAEQLLMVPHVLLQRDESYMVKGIDTGMHGDQGPNGTRGSIDKFRRLGVKSVIGHSHTPGIEEGCFQTGTNSKLRLQYNRGPSSWMHTNCVIYGNGKRALLHIIDGKWKV